MSNSCSLYNVFHREAIRANAVFLSTASELHNITYPNFAGISGTVHRNHSELRDEDQIALALAILTDILEFRLHEIDLAPP